MTLRHFRFLFLCCLSSFLVGLFILGLYLWPLCFRPMIQASDEPVTVVLDKHAFAGALAHTLKQLQLIQSERALLLLIRLQGVSHHLKAGVYQVRPSETAYHFLERVAAGDVLNIAFRIIEGTTKSQVEKRLQHAPWLTYQPEHWLGIDASQDNPEGLLLADTYFYEAGSLSKNLLIQAHEHLKACLEKNWAERSPNLPYKTPYELLITASILEKETALPSEKRLIAGVIVNRLRQNMRLQVDPTVIYALNDRYHAPLSRKDLKIDSPYNTYRYRGLPPTPIAMVGKDAIEAAAHPEITEYLYFVAKGDGSHIFSVTYEDQKKAVKRYLRKEHDN